MKKKIITIIIIIIVLAVIVFQIFLKKDKNNIKTVEVTNGTVVQEVSETGQVEKGDKINLTFKNAGRIQKINVEVGQNVKEGDVLIELETGDLKIQLQQSRAALVLAQAQLNKLLAGASQEEIKASQTGVNNAETALKNAQQNLIDVQVKAAASLSDDYEDAQNTLDDAHLKAYNSQNFVSYLQITYFYRTDQESTQVSESKNYITKSVANIKLFIDSVKADSSPSNIDSNLIQAKNELSNIANYLQIIRGTCEEPNYRSLVSSTDKSSLDTHRSYINTAITNISNSQQTISSTKTTNDYNINTAKTAVDVAQGVLDAAKDQLNILIAPARSEDIDLYRAKVIQAQADVKLLENKIADSILTSPTNGQITDINKRVGELVQPVAQDAVLVLLPENPYRIEVNIYEEDVVKVKIGDEVTISLVAFPDQTFKGKVISIDPAEKLIEGVIYYKVTIDFDNMPAGVKPGMTADVTIKTATKENVLVIPDNAIEKKDSEKFVKVFKNGKTEERKIEVGLKGSNNITEVVSGLETGEKVVIE